MRIHEYDGVTGATIFGPVQRKSMADGEDLATELLSTHLVEFDTIQAIKKRGKKIFTIRHLDGTYAPIEVLIESSRQNKAS